MKLYDIDIVKLIDLLDKAKGNVYLVTDDGDKLNLKSKLCQLVGIRLPFGKSQKFHHYRRAECGESGR